MSYKPGPTDDPTPPQGLTLIEGLDALDDLMDDCAQDGGDYRAFVRVSAVRDILNAVRRGHEWEQCSVFGNHPRGAHAEYARYAGPTPEPTP